MRFLYMDFARSILMLIGIVYHSAQVYSSSKWRISCNDTNVVFDYIISFVHSFRMESFYLISGFFSAMLIRKYGHNKFLVNRIARFLIPIFTLGLPLNYLMDLYSANRPSSLAEIVNLNYFFNGSWIGHLWFVANLTIYVILSLYIYKLIPYKIKNKFYYYLSFCIIPIFQFLILRIVWRLPEPFDGSSIFIFNTGLLYSYLPYFLLGMFLFKNKVFLQHISGNFYELLLILILLLITKNRFNNEYIVELLVNINKVALVYLTIGFFYNFFDFNNHYIKNISIASYSIYIVHQPIVVALSYFLVKTNINNFLQFFIVITLTYFLGYAFHFSIVERNDLLKFLLNGKIYRSAKQRDVIKIAGKSHFL